MKPAAALQLVHATLSQQLKPLSAAPETDAVPDAQGRFAALVFSVEAAQQQQQQQQVTVVPLLMFNSLLLHSSVSGSLKPLKLRKLTVNLNAWESSESRALSYRLRQAVLLPLMAECGRAFPDLAGIDAEPKLAVLSFLKAADLLALSTVDRAHRATVATADDAWRALMQTEFGTAAAGSAAAQMQLAPAQQYAQLHTDRAARKAQRAAEAKAMHDAWQNSRRHAAARWYSYQPPLNYPYFPPREWGAGIPPGA
jgi:hypothetical protein